MKCRQPGVDLCLSNLSLTLSREFWWKDVTFEIGWGWGGQTTFPQHEVPSTSLQKGQREGPCGVGATLNAQCR